jgi:hypothetical protein
VSDGFFFVKDDLCLASFYKSFSSKKSNSDGGKNPSDAMPASGLVLLSEVDIELKTSPPEEIKSTITVEQKKIVEKKYHPRSKLFSI